MYCPSAVFCTSQSTSTYIRKIGPNVMCFRHGHGRDGADIHPQGFGSSCLKKDGGGKINSDKYWIEWGFGGRRGISSGPKIIGTKLSPGRVRPCPCLMCAYGMDKKKIHISYSKNSSKLEISLEISFTKSPGNTDDRLTF
jgi:hypothetical protein